MLSTKQLDNLPPHVLRFRLRLAQFYYYNGPQYASQEFGFHLVTSSPRYPQSNGQAERTVQMVKRMLKKSSDMCMALLSYQATPLPWCNLSPAELLMGRHIQTPLPQTDEQRIPKWPYLQEICNLNQTFKERQEHDFNKRHRVQDLPSLPDDTNVWVTSSGEPIQGRVIGPADTPSGSSLWTGA